VLSPAACTPVVAEGADERDERHRPQHRLPANQRQPEQERSGLTPWECYPTTRNRSRRSAGPGNPLPRQRALPRRCGGRERCPAGILHRILLRPALSRACRRRIAHLSIVPSNHPAWQDTSPHQPRHVPSVPGRRPSVPSQARPQNTSYARPHNAIGSAAIKVQIGAFL
jgi:hypothetical protein